MRIQLVGGLSDREQANGKRYNITRQNPQTGVDEPMHDIRDSDELQFAMTLKDENGKDMYSTDAAYRETVKDLVANSPAFMAEQGLARKSPIPTNEEFLAGLKRDALIQRREQLVDQAGGKDAIAKLELAEALMSGEFREAALEMEAETEQARPMEEYLKSRKAAGLGPLAWRDLSSESGPEVKPEELHNAEILEYLGDSGDIIETGERS